MGRIGIQAKTPWVLRNSAFPKRPFLLQELHGLWPQESHGDRLPWHVGEGGVHMAFTVHVTQNTVHSVELGGTRSPGLQGRSWVRFGGSDGSCDLDVMFN